MAFSDNVSFCRVTYKLATGEADSFDPGQDPDAAPIPGQTVRLWASVPRVVNATANPPVTHYMKEFVYTTNLDGELVNVDGTVGAYIIATDDPDLQPTGWTWTAVVSGNGYAPDTFSFVAPSGGHIDLSTVPRVPLNPGSEIAAWAAAQVAALTASAEAQSARDEAVEAAESVAPGQPGGVAQLDGSTRLPETQVPTRLTEAQIATRYPTKNAYGYAYAVDFGCKFDGVTDDTAAFQAFVSNIAVNGLTGIMPRGTAKLTSKIDVPRRPGWQLRGSGREVTVLRQHTDNVPILDIGAVAGSQVHSYAMTDFRLTYANPQPPENTNANPILFSQEAYFGNIERLTFEYGSYAIKVAAGIGGPWGTTWDDLTFRKELTLGAMDWSQCINGVPNNHFGRLFVDASNMVGPIFAVRGYNFRIDVIELTAAHLGAKLFVLAASSKADIGSIKLENGTYGAAQNGMNLIELQGNAYARIGHVTLTGHTMIVSGATIFLFGVNVGNGVGGFLSVDAVEVSLSSLTNGNAYIAAPATNAQGLELNTILIINSWKIFNSTSSTAANRTTIRTFQNSRLSLDRGDADYTITPGDPTTVIYNTPLTTSRSVTLPTDLTMLPNGLSYDIVSAGAVNGSNVLLVKQGATTIATLSATRSRVRVAFRRNSSGTINEWFVLPA